MILRVTEVSAKSELFWLSDRQMIDATHLKAHRTAASLPKKGLFPAVLGERRTA
jgi:hypothetical protein